MVLNRAQMEKHSYYYNHYYGHYYGHYYDRPRGTARRGHADVTASRGLAKVARHGRGPRPTAL